MIKNNIAALAIIALANFFNYMDRFILSAMGPDVKQDFGLSEVKFNSLWTLFTIGYMVAAPIVGLLADKWKRNVLFGIAVLIWSGATVASGMAKDYTQIAICRLLTGIGEAGCLVIGPSLLADFFHRDVRNRVFSIFFLGLPFGGIAGYLLGGFIREIYSWREGFMAAGLPGFLIGILLFAMSDPPRGAGDDVVGQKSARFKDYLGLIKNKTLILIIFAQTFSAMVLAPLLHNGTSFMEKEKRIEPKESVIILGLSLAGGMIGTVISGIIGDKASKKFPGAYAFIASIGFFLAMPLLMGMGMAADEHTLAIFSVFGATCLFACMPAVNTQIANVTSPMQRATAYSVTVFFMHLLGDTFSPIIFGEVADRYGLALPFTAMPMLLLVSSFACYIASRTAAGDVEKAKAPSA